MRKNKRRRNTGMMLKKMDKDNNGGIKDNKKVYFRSGHIWSLPSNEQVSIIYDSVYVSPLETKMMEEEVFCLKEGLYSCSTCCCLVKQSHLLTPLVCSQGKIRVHIWASCSLKTLCVLGTSLAVQWLTLELTLQGVWVWFLVREPRFHMQDST